MKTDVKNSTHQMVTPLDSLLQYDSDPVHAMGMLDHLITNWHFDVSKKCVFQDGSTGPALENCVYLRIKQAPVDGQWHFIMHHLINISTKLSNSELYTSIETVRNRN